jgi:DNA-binding transcriptional LysR family regulator
MGKIAAATAAVRVVEPPREIKDLTYFMAWHARPTTDPPHAWFRDQLRMAARSIRTK